MITTNDELVLNLRERAPAFFAASLFAPAECRDAYRVLSAFLMEMEHVLALATDPMMSAIRFTWWSEQLEAMPHGRVERHPLNEGLLDVVKTNEDVLPILLAMVHRAHDALDNNENAFLHRDHRQALWAQACCAMGQVIQPVPNNDPLSKLGSALFVHMMTDESAIAPDFRDLPRAYAPLWLPLVHKGKRGPVGPLSLVKMLWAATRGRI